LILQPPPFEGFLAVQQVGAGQFQFLFQKVLVAQEIALQGLFAALLRLLVLVVQALLDYPGLLLIADRRALIKRMAVGELLLPVTRLSINEFLRPGPLALPNQKVAGSAFLILLQLAAAHELFLRPGPLVKARFLPGLLVDHRCAKRAALERMEGPCRRGQSKNKGNDEKCCNMQHRLCLSISQVQKASVTGVYTTH